MGLLLEKRNRKKSSAAYSKPCSNIGLDLGSRMIKLLQLKHERNREIVAEICVIPTPPGAIQNGKIVSAGKLIKELHLIKKDFNWQGKEVCLSLSNRSCHLRKVTMPTVPGRELPRAMQLAAETHFPHNYHSLVTGFCSTAAPNHHLETEDKPVEYLLAAVEKEISDSYSKLVLEAGFYPAAIEAAPAALLRSLGHNQLLNHRQPHGRRFLLDCGYQSTTLYMFSEGSYRFHRCFNIGMEHFKKALRHPDQSAGSKINREKLLFQKASLQEKGLAELADKLSRHINESLDYFLEKEGLKEKQPPSLEVCGGSIFIPGLAIYLKHSLNIKLGLYDSLKASTRKHQDTNPYEGPLFHLAHGLALRGWIN